MFIKILNLLQKRQLKLRIKYRTKIFIKYLMARGDLEEIIILENRTVVLDEQLIIKSRYIIYVRTEPAQGKSRAIKFFKFCVVNLRAKVIQRAKIYIYILLQYRHLK